MDCMRNNFVPGVLLDGRFRTVSPLNHGSFGMVFRAFDIISKEYVALKCVVKSVATSAYPSTISTDDDSEELTIHRRIGKHRNIVNLIHSFETPHHAYLVLEFCSNGDLYEAIRVGKGPGQTDHIRDFMHQLIASVEHMHSKGVFHRDIKPENIFLARNGDVKLGDFGLATTDTWSTEYAVGSDRYMAPEQYDPNGSGYDPAAADIWSIGICLLNILFSRNPFAQPTPSDPLYRDFMTDRQTLFDVFPTMSYDTFEVLIHCLAIDPDNRSLRAVKDALNRAVTFTTDDESLDEFCTATSPVAVATANREPLRTPSVATPQLDSEGHFPWAKALALSPPQQIRQLSAIPDTEFSESLFPSSEDEANTWTSSKPDSASVDSFIESGLGVSFKSTNAPPEPAAVKPINFERPKPSATSGSLPISAARPIMSMHTSRRPDMFSKSWSDMVDEDEEAMMSDVGNTSYGFAAQLKAIKSRDWGSGESSDGRSTPRNRVVLGEVSPSSINNSRSRSIQNLSELVDKDTEATAHISEHTGFVFEEHASPVTPRRTPLKKQSMPDLERWAKLGARRRGEPQLISPLISPLRSGQVTPKPAKREADVKMSTPAPRKRSDTRVGSWRGRDREFWVQRDVKGKEYKDDLVKGGWVGAVPLAGQRDGDSDGFKVWSTSKDWRQHSPTQASTPSRVAEPRSQHSYYTHLFRKHTPQGRGGAQDVGQVWREDLHL